ncbi:hypothetical protein VNO77_31212 [Canavalia gladiata]|uniref:Uncharacterized protein n=1 Tax=Canavalia gladiata TaxID=3824 RepID=A0AAN9KPH5_CANGL
MGFVVGGHPLLLFLSLKDVVLLCKQPIIIIRCGYLSECRVRTEQVTSINAKIHVMICSIHDLPLGGILESFLKVAFLGRIAKCTCSSACMAISLPDVGRDELFRLDMTDPSLNEYLNFCTGETFTLITPCRYSKAPALFEAI